MFETDKGETPLYETNFQESPSSDDKKPLNLDVSNKTNNSPSNIKIIFQKIKCNCKSCDCRYSSLCLLKSFLIIILLYFIISGFFILIIGATQKTELYDKKSLFTCFIIFIFIYEICDIFSLIMVIMTNFVDSRTCWHKIKRTIIIVLEFICLIAHLVILEQFYHYFYSPYRGIIQTYMVLNFILRVIYSFVEYYYLGICELFSKCPSHLGEEYNSNYNYNY